MPKHAERRVFKGVHFVDIRDAGDPVECARAYCETGADAIEWAMRVDGYGVPVILPTSKAGDGVQTGYDLPVIRTIRKAVTSLTGFLGYPRKTETWESTGHIGNRLIGILYGLTGREPFTKKVRFLPYFPEWMMGWPIGWTDLRPLAMGKFQRWSNSFGKPLPSKQAFQKKRKTNSL